MGYNYPLFNYFPLGGKVKKNRTHPLVWVLTIIGLVVVILFAVTAAANDFPKMAVFVKAQLENPEYRLDYTSARIYRDTVIIQVTDREGNLLWVGEDPVELHCPLQLTEKCTKKSARG